MMMQDIILVNEFDQAIGIGEKWEVHKKALLHRAFSVFIFNKQGQMLIHQRAFSKYHSGGLWTNACCSHPSPNEEIKAAAQRRLIEEMGFSTELKPAFQFIYKAELDNGLTEHEYDHVFIGEYDGMIFPDPEEVNAYSYKTIEEIKSLIKEKPEEFTEWFKIAFPLVVEGAGFEPRRHKDTK